MPKRIQRKRTKGFRLLGSCIYVGRPTKWSNPYRVATIMRDDGCSKETAQFWASARFAFSLSNCEHHELLSKAERQHFARIKRDIHELRDKDVCCYCGVEDACHGDILLELANRPEAPNATP